MINYYTKRSRSEQFEQLSKPLLRDVWVDGDFLNQTELQTVTDQYGLDTNIIRDVQDKNELPRLEISSHDGGAYIFIRQPWLARSGRVATLPLLCILKEDLFLTLSTGRTIEPDVVAATSVLRSTNDTESLLLGVLASCIATYEDLIVHTERRIADTANRLRTHEVTNHDFVQFVTVEDNLNTCKMNLDSTLAMVTRLRDGRKLLDDDGIEALEDICLHIQQLLVAVDSHNQSVTSIRNAYSTIANNRLNQRMKTLTVLTVLITLPNVIYGMYGMNVPLPFQEAGWSYLVIVGVSIAVILAVYAVAKRFRIF